MKNFKTYQNFVSENINEATKEQEAVAFRIKLLLKQGKSATVSMGEKKLYKLSEAFEEWLIDADDNKYEGITAHLDMAIELIQERETKEAVPHMNKFNKACVKALKGLKESVTESRNDYSRDEIAQSEFGLDYDQLGKGEKEWVDDEIENNESVDEANGAPRGDLAIKDIEKEGSEINWLDDANAATKKIWKKAGVNPEDENTVILYSYVANSWPSVKKILKKNSVDFKELEDPNAAGESMIVFVNESINEAAPRITTSKETETLLELRDRVANSHKGGSSRYSKEFDKAKTKALRAIEQMLTYTKIGI
jgi:hypothetical protein